MLTRQNIVNKFEELYPNNYASAFVYFNECNPKNGFSIQIGVGRLWSAIRYIYLYLNENNQISKIKNSDSANLFLGECVDISSFNDTYIQGNHKDRVGKVLDGKLVIGDNYGN